MIFIDWLSVYQDHPAGDLPVVGKEFKVTYEVETGDKVFEAVTGMRFEGSYETSLRVRCDGRRVEVSGNPSGFSRADNLWGFVEMQDCIDLYNEILAGLGLPMFCHAGSAPATLLPYQAAHSDVLIGMFEPVITRVDLTQNLSTPDALLYLRSLSGYVHQGRAGFLYPNCRTLEWNGKYNGFDEGASKRVYIKYYIKEADVDSKIGKLAKVYRNTIQDEEIEVYKLRHSYLRTVKEYCANEAIVRHEVSFKAKYLSQHGLSSIHKWSKEVMSNIIRPYQFHNRLKVEQSDIQNTVEQLIAQEVPLRIAKRADIVLNAWLQGKKLHFKDGGLSKTEFYRMRKVLLLVGVDIALPCQLSHIPLQSIKMTVKPLDPPEWYKMPEKPRLSLVA